MHGRGRYPEVVGSPCCDLGIALSVWRRLHTSNQVHSPSSVSRRDKAGGRGSLIARHTPIEADVEDHLGEPSGLSDGKHLEQMVVVDWENGGRTKIFTAAAGALGRWRKASRRREEILDSNHLKITSIHIRKIHGMLRTSMGEAHYKQQPLISRQTSNGHIPRHSTPNSHHTPSCTPTTKSWNHFPVTPSTRLNTIPMGEDTTMATLTVGSLPEEWRRR
ncbi:hypothetical protein M409DRAFT_59340 [Zasmidium cellare ATCC 36951]|uniref:Uncharacterized protein n=1 Tax=Zasmidium cellare ATCC 36951 TaxID=1080233 RepID=A0A6A6C4F1_ZASCE|nr:uncharacterized protein M409DRAFT_59340 [Zasmidium cellare ATCC 36951]KAF2161060.1 hypothetical protein M409DRAFT_59340 [Zasmidium cellare ATCC 36951]